MSSIYTLVDNINSLDSEDTVSVINLNGSYMVRKIRDGMSPSMVTLNEKEAEEHLLKIYNRKLKSLEKNIKVVRNKVYEVWYDGGLIGLYRGTSFYEVCIEASRNLGLDTNNVMVSANGGINYSGKNFYSSEMEMLKDRR